MERKESRLVIDGNAFYELDLECVRRRENRKKTMEGSQYQPEPEDRKTSFLHSVMQNF